MITVKRNYCNCHPETCCCDPYKVVDDSGKTIATFYDKSDAKRLVDMLNKPEAAKKVRGE